MDNSEKFIPIITLLFSGFGGVCVGALITYYLQGKSIIEKKKDELLDQVLKRSWSGAELVYFVAEVARRFQSQSIQSNLEDIIRIFSDTSKTNKDLPALLRKQFIELAKSMREDIGISKDFLTDQFIEKLLNQQSYTR